MYVSYMHVYMVAYNDKPCEPIWVIICIWAEYPQLGYYRYALLYVFGLSSLSQQLHKLFHIFCIMSDGHYGGGGFWEWTL